MNDCISRQAVLNLIDMYGGIDYKARQDMLKIIQNMPSAIPTERIGHWIDHQMDRWIYAKCSECGTIHDTQTNYCPNCGAEMSESKYVAKNIGGAIVKGIKEGLKDESI